MFEILGLWIGVGLCLCFSAQRPRRRRNRRRANGHLPRAIVALPASTSACELYIPRSAPRLPGTRA